LIVQTLMAFVVGGLYAAGFYLMMRRSIVKLIIGLAVLSHATNLLIFLMGGMIRGRPPVIPAAAERMTGTFADPLPQALILTAIVIGFGVQAFAVVLIRRTHQTVGTDDLDELQTTDTM
jgi:multicomponent Na+:H+ antiporter subunit C